jgi:hypothetical protein
VDAINTLSSSSAQLLSSIEMERLEHEYLSGAAKVAGFLRRGVARRMRPSTSRRRLAAMLLVLSAVVATAALRPPPLARDVPQVVRQTLTAAYGAWQFAPLNPQLRALVPKRTDGAVLTADFDGDGRRDYAVHIVTGVGAARLRRVVVLLRRGTEYVPFSIQDGPPADNIYLVLARKGERRADLDADENGGKTIRLQTDAIDIIYAEAAATTCIFERTAFRCMTTGD